MSVIHKGLLPIVALGIGVIALLLLAYPHASLYAALQGMTIWWEILFPALFPFFLLSEILLGFGIVHFFGTLLDPFMRPLFRVPGIGGFVMAMGFASGYPVGARLTARLWEDRLVTREEGERLVAFTTTSDPIFLIGAVSVGFFHDARLAVVLACAHYGSAIMLGLFMRFYGRTELRSPPVDRKTAFPNNSSTPRQSLLPSAFHAMHVARLQDGRPIGLLLQQSIRTSIELVLIIGGLVVFFSVFMELMRVSHMMNILEYAVQSMLQFIHIPPVLSESFVNGIFEVTLGAKAAGSPSGPVPLLFQVMMAAFVLSWAGFSVHGQIVSLLYRTNIRYLSFMIARLVHGIMAALLVLLLWSQLQPAATGKLVSSALPAMAILTDETKFNRSWLYAIPFSIFILMIALSVLAGALHYFFNRLYNRLNKRI